jgi:hypothetical protein
MIRLPHDSKIKRELAAMRIAFPLAGLAVFVAIGGMYWWRLAHFEHSVARIDSIWDEERRVRGATEIVTMAELTFKRRAPTGDVIACKYRFQVGTPKDGLKVGDKLEIVPARGTCDHIDIIGRSS